jgi:hypothetical protein
MDIQFEITESTDYGTVVQIFDTEWADQFEDFLTEKCYVLFNTKLEQNGVTFFFGQASSSVKVRELFDRFLGESHQNNS